MLEQVTPVRTHDAGGTHGRRGNGQTPAADNLPDLLLIERARGADERAIEALIRRYSRRLYRVARSVLADENAAEAAVQEAYLAAFGDLNRYEPTGKFAAWLTRLAFNQARALRVGVRPGDPGTPAQPPATAADASGEHRGLEYSIGGLPEVFRTVFVMRAVEGISGIETAASLGVHETTVRTRMYRAQRRLDPETLNRVRATRGLFELAPERADRIVTRVLAQLPHGSMATISASTP